MFFKKKKSAFTPGRLVSIIGGNAMPTKKELKALKKLYKSLEDDYNNIPTTPIDLDSLLQEDEFNFSDPFSSDN